MFLLGICLFIVIVIITILVGASLSNFIDLASFVFVIITNISILISTNSFKDFWYGVQLLIFNNKEVDIFRLTESMKIFGLLQKSSIGISILGFLIGLISVLSHLSEPSMIGPSIAVALLIVFYSILVSLVVISPAKYILSKIERKATQKNV